MEPAFPYQVTGANWLAKDGRRGLGDSMGIGKSRQAIMAADKVGAERMIVVAPAGAHRVGVWQSEFKKWSTIRRRILKGKDTSGLVTWLKGKADVLLLSYEMAVRWSSRIEQARDLIDVIISDEAHNLKTATAQRTRQLLGTHCHGENGLYRWGVHVWPLSGTFIPNDPIDIWAWLRFLGGTSLSHSAFSARYFRKRVGAFSVAHTPRDESVNELRAAIRSVILKRTADEVGLQLPPMFNTTREIDGDSSEIVSFLRDFPGLDAAIYAAIEQGGLSSNFLDAPHIATLRRLIGQAKAAPYAEMVAEELHGGLDKIVIMGIHVDALQLIRSTLTAKGFDCVQVVGGGSDKNAFEANRRFAEDPNCRVFIGNLHAAGTALTLTAANHLDLVEQWWGPAVNAQAIKRVHRLTQQRNVFTRLISLRGSLDETVAKILERKIEAILKTEGRAA